MFSLLILKKTPGFSVYPTLERYEISKNIEESWKTMNNLTYSASFGVLFLPNRKHQDWFGKTIQK